MAMELPPSRYRVIERGRRLDVIDTLAGQRPAYAPEARPQPWAAPETMPADSLDLPQAELAEAEAAPVPRPFAPVGSMPEAPPDVLIGAASLFGSARDGDGRLLLDTARWYDAKGPRTIALDQAAERKLGAAVLVLLAIAVVAIVASVVIGWAGFVMLFVAVSLAGRIKSIATPWLDRLAAAGR